jgi:hypothetical protein
MKVKEYSVEFSKTFIVTVFAPETATRDEVRRVAEDVRMDIDRVWDPPEWECYVSMSADAEIPEEDRAVDVHRNAHGYTIKKPRWERFHDRDVLVVDDVFGDLVAPEDAEWWLK